MLQAIAGQQLPASVSGFPTGLAGTVGVQILDATGAVVTARTTQGIAEVPAGSGTYLTTLVAPNPPTSPTFYVVLWDQGTISPGTTSGEPLSVTAAAAPAADPRLTWLRRMVSDVAVTEAELITAPGVATEFYVANPPIGQPPNVTVNGLPQATPGQFTYTDHSIVLTSPPAQGAQIVIRYARTTFTDDELMAYITSAQTDHGYVQTNHIVYRAAITVIDTLLMGAATALDFGSGQENFAMSSVFNRLLELREMFEAWIAEDIEIGSITISELVFDSLDPGFPSTFDPDSIDYSNQTPTGSPPGFPGAFPTP